jgi:DNA-binding winged helix-turn-helix (wHTH) protein
MEQSLQLFELGKLYCDRGEFTLAEETLNKASDLFLLEKNMDHFLKSQNLLLRVFAEKEDFVRVNQTKEKLQDLLLKEGLTLSSQAYYVLAISATYKEQFDLALEYAQKSLSLALSSDNKHDICYAIYTLAKCYATPHFSRYSDALKEIYNLEVFFQVYNFPDLKVATLFLNASILNHLKKYDEAINVLWSAYDQLKETKNVVMANYLFIALADLYFETGEKDLARTYISLAERAIDFDQQKRLARTFFKYQQKIGVASQNSYDMIFNEASHTVLEKKMGKIDFKNQFILLDLLRLFAQNQGAVYSKEYLVENVWKQPYDPAVHDNKIYVTIKRLRKLIEPDYDKPKYIFRAKNGYYMNKAARIQIQN